jgi:DNA polymerase-1
MKNVTVNIAGAERPVDVVSMADNLDDVQRQIARFEGPLAVDVETTGLDIYGRDFRIRMVQVATMEKAWVFPVEAEPELSVVVAAVLASRPVLLAHNASYDLLCLDRFGYLDLEEAWTRTVDTRLLGHLLDPRSKADGAVGHNLENMASHYLGEDAHRYAVDLAAHVKAAGWSKAEGFVNVSISEPIFHRYGAADVLTTCWLFEALTPLVQARGFTALSNFEHEVASVTCVMQRKGIRVDLGYAPSLSAYLLESKVEAELVAATYGVENVNSTAQVAEALRFLGASLSKTTNTGKLAVDKEVLMGLELAEGPVGELARAVRQAKTASGNETKYVSKVVDGLGFDGRCRPSINSLLARTARMSISDPPLQQLPAGDWRIRRLFIASEGMVIGAADYAQIELRVMGALGHDRKIIEAVNDGVDLHDLTATRLGIGRRLAKTSNFLAAYGGGVQALAAQAGVTHVKAKATLDDWWSTFDGVRRYSEKLQRGTRGGSKPIVTATGRELPLDRNRSYAALNYAVQSSARDVFAQGLLNVRDAGLLDRCMIPVHDEVIYEATPEDIDEVSRGIGEALSQTVLGMPMDAEGETFGMSWGHGYGATS